MRTSISIGDYTTTPYVVSGLEIPVYCAEELCYCIKENAFLLDAGFMSDALIDWIGSKCGLKELAKELKPLVHRQGTLSTFAVMILQYVGLYDMSTIRGVEQVLKKGAGLSSIERRKKQVDYLVEKKKYRSAVRGYEGLLSKWRELEQDNRELPAASVRAAILHNMGAAYAGLMRYGCAAECFMQAYEANGENAHYMAFLAAKRMELKEEEYIAFAAELSDSYESTLQLERMMERLRKEWEQQADCQRLKTRKAMRFGGDKQKYYDENDRLTRALEDSYRECVTE